MAETPTNYQPIHYITQGGLSSALGDKKPGIQNTVLVEDPFLGVTSQEYSSLMEKNEAEFNATVQDVYNSMSPYIGKAYSRETDLATYSKLLPDFVSGVQKAGTAMFVTTPKGISSAFKERMAKRRFYSWVGENATQEEVRHVQFGIDALLKAGYTEEEISMMADPNNAEMDEETGRKIVPGEYFSGKTEEIVYFGEKDKEIFRKWQEMKKWEKEDAYFQKAKEILGEELSGKILLGPLELEYRDTDEYKQEWQSVAAEGVGQVVGEAAPMLLTGGTTAALRAGSFAVSKLVAKQVGNAALKKYVGKKGLYAAGFIGKSVSARVGDIVARRWGTKLGTIAAIGGKGVFYSSSFARGYESARTYALSKGVSYDEANFIGIKTGLFTAATEGWAFDDFLSKAVKTEGFLTTYFNNMVLPEALQEGFQTLGEQIINVSHGLDPFDMRSILTETIMASALGAVGGAFYSFGPGFTKRVHGIIANRLKSDSDIKAYNEKLKNRKQKTGGEEGPTDDDGTPPTGAAPANLKTEKDKIFWRDEVPKDLSKLPDDGYVLIESKKLKESGISDPIPMPAKKYKQLKKASKGNNKTFEKNINNWLGKEELKIKKEVASKGISDVETENKIAEESIKAKKEEDKKIQDAIKKGISPVETTPAEIKGEEQNGVVVDKELKSADIYPSAGVPSKQFATAEAKLQAFYNRLHLSRNKAAKKEELLAGWKLVKNAIFAESKGDVHVVDLIDAYVDSMFNNINSQSEWVKSNVNVLKTKFGDSLDAETIKNLSSSDPSVRLETQFKFVDEAIRKTFKESGNESTGVLISTLFKRMYYDLAAYGFVNPLELYSNMVPTIVNISRARLNGQINTEAIHSILDSFVKHSADVTASETATKVSDIIEKFEKLQNGITESDDAAMEEERLINEIASFFFQTSSKEFQDLVGNKKKALELYLILKDRADQEKAILKNIDGAQELAANLTEDNYLMMAIMREFGYSQEQIIKSLNAVGLKGAPVSEQQYQEGLQKTFPMLNNKELEALKRLEATANGTDYAHSSFVPNENIITVGMSQRHGELVHESIHWLITHALMREAEIMSKGLPGGNARLRALLEAYIEKYPMLGEITGAKFQETVIEGLMDSLEIQNIHLAPEKKKNYVNTRTKKDTELAELFSKVMDEVDYVKRTPKGSIASEIQQNKRAQKEFLSSTLDLFSKSHTQVMFDGINQLRHAMNFGTKKEMLEQANKFITANNAIIPGAEVSQIAINSAKKEGVSIFDAKNVLEDVINTAQIAVIEHELSSIVEGNKQDDKDAIKDSKILTQLKEGQDKMARQILHFMPTASGAAAISVKPRMMSSRFDLIENAKNFAINHIKNPSLVLESIGDLWNAFTATVYKDSQSLGNELYNIVFNASKADKERKAHAQKHIIGLHDIFAKHAKTIPDAEFNRFQRILFNGDKTDKKGKVIYDAEKAAYRWLEAYIPIEDLGAAQKHFAEIIKIFEFYPSELAKHGVELKGYLSGFYWPRYMARPKEYAMSKGYNDSLSQTSKTRKQLSSGDSKKDKRDLINALSSIGIKNADDPTKMTVLMKRTNQHITDDEMPFYANIFASAMKYVETNSQTIFMRTLFGRVQKDSDGKLIGFDKNGNPTNDFSEIIRAQDGQVGLWLNKYFKEMKRMKQLPDEKALKRLESSLFSMAMKGTKKNPLFDTAIAMSTAVHLTQITNTINQLGEMQITAMRFGTKHAYEAFMDVMKGNPNVVTLEDINSQETEIDRLVEAEALSLLRLATKNAQKWTGFTLADAKMKETTMRAGILEAKDAIMLEQKKAKGEKLSASEEARIKEFYALAYRFAAIDDIASESKKKNSAKIAKLEKLKADILADNKSKEIKDFSEQILTDTQPIDLASRLSVMNGGSAMVRGALIFKSVAIRQIDWIQGYFARGFKEGAAEGARRIANFVVLGLLIGLPKEALKDVIDGKEPDFHFFNSIAGPAFLNSYVISVAKREGMGAAITEQFAQPFSFLDGPSKDIASILSGELPKLESSKNIPVVGKFVYNWFLGGHFANKKKGISIY